MIVLTSNKTSDCLHRAKRSKQEFPLGDNIENRGDSFMDAVSLQMNRANQFLQCPVLYVNVDGKSIEQVHDAILPLILAFGR